MTEELKPCPFCGGVAKLNAPGYENYSPYWCKCTQCGAEGPTKSSELEAEKGWNKRVYDDVEHASLSGGRFVDKKEEDVCIRKCSECKLSLKKCREIGGIQ